MVSVSKRAIQEKYAKTEKGRATQRRADEKRSPLRVKRHSERVKQAKSSGCVECGSDINLEFHHCDPTTKRYTVAVMTNASDETFRTEIEKCVVLCNTCHINMHKIAR